MGADFVGGDEFCPNHIPNRRVIGGQAGGLPVADQVSTAVANMYQMQCIVKNVGGGKRRPHPACPQTFSLFINTQVGGFDAAPQGLGVRSAISIVQSLSQLLNGESTGNRSVSVTAHAVSHRVEQTRLRRILSIRQMDGVLIIFPHWADVT